MSIVFRGMDRFIGALTAAPKAMDAATGVATAASARIVEAAAKKNLSRTSHEKGTPTPSAPGEPPALVSGRLRNSIRVEGPTRLGLGRWQARVSPTAVYGRIQELGGVTGRGHATHLPARPYIAPAVAQTRAEARQAYWEAWRAAWRGRA